MICLCGMHGSRICIVMSLLNRIYVYVNAAKTLQTGTQWSSSPIPTILGGLNVCHDLYFANKTRFHILNHTVFHWKGTSRDSAKTVQKWISQLPYDTVRLVEDACTAFMEMAGYTPVRDEEFFQRNKSIKYFLNDIPLLASETELNV